MSQTTTAPSVINSPSDFFGSLGNLVLDVARHKYIDLETTEDDNNMPDYVDVKTGQVNTRANVGGVGGMFANFTPLHWVALTVAGGLAFGLATGKFK